jgi:site-specific recombinase XerD
MATRTESTRRPIEILSREEVDKLMKACSRRAPSGLRDRALIAVLYGAGLRVGEALDLRLKDLNFDNSSIAVRHGKGDRQRVVGIDAGNLAILQSWLDCRERLEISSSAPVFCAITKGIVGKPLDQAQIRMMLARRRKRADIEKRVHAHGFRHSHAADLAASGLPINIIQSQLGHSNAATTSRYIDHLNPRQVIEAVRNRHQEAP